MEVSWFPAVSFEAASEDAWAVVWSLEDEPHDLFSMVSNELRWKGTGAVCVAGCAPPAGSGCQSDMGPVHGHTSGNRSVKGTKKRPNYGHTIIETNKNPRCHSN